MLIPTQLKHIEQLQKTNNFDYLRPQSLVFDIRIPQDEYFEKNSNKRGRRRIYNKVQYEEQQIKGIEQMKMLLQRQQITQQFTDQIILKHLHTAQFDNQKTLKRLSELDKFYKTPQITNFSSTTLSNLRHGSIYLYGHSHTYLPIIIIRVDKLELNSNIDSLFNIIYYLMIIIKHYKMVPYHAQRYILIMDLNHMNVSRIPLTIVYNALSKLSLYYCGLTEKTVIINGEGIGWVWILVSKLIPEHSIQKVLFVDQHNNDKLLSLISQNQLQQKYGGKQPNITEYWPPQIPSQTPTCNYQNNENSDYYSVQNNLLYFQLSDNKKDASCCQCNIY